MKKFKILSSLIALTLVVIMSVSSVFAETYFIIGDYKFSRNNHELTIAEYLGESKDVVIPETIMGDTVVAINSSIFENKKDVESIVIPNTVTNIDQFSFYNLKSLKSVTMPNSLKIMGMSTFQYSTLNEVDLSNTKLTSIPAQMVYSCPNVSKVLLPETATNIGAYAFSTCPELNYVYIPAGVEEIGKNAFKNSPNLVIYGVKDSFAHNYADVNKIPFVAVKEYKVGDVDMSGRIDVKDATLIQRYLARISSLTEYQLSLADVNNDRAVNINDVTAIQTSIVQ